MRLVRYSLMLLGWLATSALAAETVELYIPDAPPLAFQNYQRGHGIVGDMALASINHAGLLATVVAVPWARAQVRVSSGKGVLITPLSRTPEREDKFTWIAPIMSLERAFFTLGTPVSSFDDARRRYSRIAVGLGTIQEAILLREGFSREQIVSIKLGEIPISLLKLGRVDAWFTSIPEALYLWPEGGPELHMSPILDATDVYLACSKNCDPELVQRLKLAVEQLHQTGALNKFKQVYLPEP